MNNLFFNTSKLFSVSGLLKLFLILGIFISAQMVLAPSAYAKGETYKWINKNKIQGTGGVYGGESFTFQRSTGAFSNPDGSVKTAEAYIYSEDAAGIYDSGRNCNLRFGIIVQAGKASATLQPLFADPSFPQCPDITSLSQTVTVTNTGAANDRPENFDVIVTTERPKDKDYNSDTITLKDQSGNELGKKKVDKSNQIATSDEYTAYKVRFKNISGTHNYVEACSEAIGKCSPKSGLADLLLGPLDEGGVYIEIKEEIPIEGETTSCAVDGLGWIVCPVMTFMAKLNDAAFGFLNNYLTISPKIFNDPVTLSAWGAFRNIANVAFVAAFLIIIYSQITGGGFTNYGIKKLLPKLVIAAVLVNVSFYACAVLVDASNIAGESLYNLLTGFSIGDDSGGGGALSTIWTKGAAVLLGATAVIGLLALIIFAPMSLLAFALVIMILVARQAFVILLIVISPLAFVAYMLPNTESLFKKWWKALSAMLMVFPIIAVVFGASTLAATILLKVSEDGAGGGDDQQMLKIVAAGVMAVPLFAVPLLLKGSLAAAGSIGGKIAGLQDKTSGRAKGQAGEKYKNSAFGRGRSARKQLKQQYRDRQYAAGVSGIDTGTLGKMRARASRGVIGRGVLPAGKYAQKRIVGAAELAADKHFDDDVKAAGLGYAGLSNAAVADIAKTGKHNGEDVTIEELAAAHDRIMASGSFDERREALEYAASQTGTGSKHDSSSLRQRSVAGAMKRGDGGIYGVGFGNKIVDGGIRTKQELAQEAVNNAAGGNVSGAHLVQSKGATEYLVDVSRGAKTALTPGSAAAVAGLKIAAGEAASNPSTSKDVTPEIAGVLGRL